MRKFIISVFLLASASPAFPGGEAETFTQMTDSLLAGSVRLIQAEEFQNMIASGKEIFIIDSRSSSEYEISRLENAIFIDYETFNPIKVENIAKSATIVVYCSVGYRSEKTGEKLLDAGFSDVYNLNGGIFQWVNEGRKIYNSTGETARIHGYSEDWAKWLERGEVIY